MDIPGHEPSAALERSIADAHIGGVVLFRKNVVSPTQVARLTSEIQRIAREAGAPALWMAIDHEGGAVNRFAPADTPSAGSPIAGASRGTAGPHVTMLPSAMALGATGDPALGRQAGFVAGRELRSMGIHQNYAPVLDVNNNPANPVIGARAFGESPALVEAMGLAYIHGLQDAGVAATAKHFPGHGDVTVDSHVALPRVAHGIERLDAVELPPFAAAVRAGVAAVMTAHIVFQALDPAGVPATMSGPILNGILRERWGYLGLILSDSLTMRAIVDHFGVGDAAIAAVRAGCDILLALGPQALQQEVLEHLARAIETGEIPAARVAEALARVEAAAGRWGLDGSALASGPRPAGFAAAVDPAAVDPAEHDRIARQIAEAAVTLVRDRNGVIPLKATRVGVVTVSAEGSEHGPVAFAPALRRYHTAVREMAANDPTTDLDCVIVVTCTRGTLPPAHGTIIRNLHAKVGDRLVVLATGDPYDLLHVPEILAYLVTYGTDAPSLDAAARVLLGTIPPRGRLPVMLPGLYPAGHRWSGSGTQTFGQGPDGGVR